MKTEEELKKRLSDLELGMRLIEQGDIPVYSNTTTKIKMLREIEFLREVLK